MSPSKLTAVVVLASMLGAIAALLAALALLDPDAPVAPQARDGERLSALADEVAAQSEDIRDLRAALERIRRAPAPDAHADSDTGAPTVNAASPETPSAGVAAAAREAVRELLGDPNGRLREVTQAVLEEIERERAEAKARKRRESMLADQRQRLTRRLGEIAARYGLSDDQAASLLASMERTYQQVLLTDAADVTDSGAIQALTMASLDDLRQAMNPGQFRQYRRDRVEEYRRPQLRKLYEAAGVDAGQRAAIEYYMRGHWDRLADYDVRLTSGDLTQAERLRTKAEYAAATNEGWKYIADNFLTPEQAQRALQAVR